jgi:hypothetical protein
MEDCGIEDSLGGLAVKGGCSVRRGGGLPFPMIGVLVFSLPVSFFVAEVRTGRLAGEIPREQQGEESAEQESYGGLDLRAQQVNAMVYRELLRHHRGRTRDQLLKVLDIGPEELDRSLSKLLKLKVVEIKTGKKKLRYRLTRK